MVSKTLIFFAIACVSISNSAPNNYNFSYPLNNDTLNTSIRRRFLNVINFNAPNQFLNGVAAISWTAHAVDTFCTGAYVNPPNGFTPAANKYYVVTAAHCLYDRNGYPAAVWEDVADLRVEFGLTGSAVPGSLGITTCTVDDYRIYNQYVMSNVNEIEDYAVMKIDCLVAPTNPFTIQNFKNRIETDEEFGRAGYRGTRILKKEEHYRIRNSHYKRGNRKNIGGVMISRGVAGGGDSGSPVYDTSNDHNLRAVFSGIYYGPTRAVKITSKVHKHIDNMIKAKDGISPLTVDCQVAPYGNTECWSLCVLATDAKPSKCYTDDDGVNDYLSPSRALPCEYGRIKYLCGPIKDCSKSTSKTDKDKKCLSACTNAGAHNCPANRPNIAVVALPTCKGRNGLKTFDGNKYVCNGIGHAIIDCVDGTYNDEQCWGPEEHKKKKICFESATQIRYYHKSGRKSEQGDTRDNIFKHLCGPVIDCSDKYKDKRCYSQCTNAGVQNCPAARGAIGGPITIPCRGKRGGIIPFDGTKYLCDRVYATPDCGPVSYLEEECWGPCAYKTRECYSTALQTRDYAKSKRFKFCGFQNQQYQRLCGPVKDCTTIFRNEARTKQCLGKCKRAEADSCPGTRNLVNGGLDSVGCGNGRHKWLCSVAAHDSKYGDEMDHFGNYDDDDYYDNDDDDNYY